MQRSSTDQLNHTKNGQKVYTPEPRSPDLDTKPVSAAKPKRDENEGKKKQNPKNKGKDAVKPSESKPVHGKIDILFYV